MDSPSDRTSDREAEPAPPRLRVVLDLEVPEIDDARAAAQEVDRVEARLLELLLVSEYLKTDDLLGVIDGAIEECEERVRKLAPESEPLLHLVV